LSPTILPPGTPGRSAQELGRAAFRIAGLLVEASEARYRKAPILGSSSSWTPTTKDHSDPTLDTVLDEKRSSLSDAARAAEEALQAAELSLAKAHRKLEAALERWHGE
jgi:hypothetical protein